MSTLPQPDGIAEFSATQGLTAHAGGGQASATLLPSYVNEVSTVATAADSVMLPASIPGAKIYVINDTAATSMQVFGQPGDTIAAHGSNSQTASATGVAQAGATIACYVCFGPGVWKQFLTA